jgi:hypothetical protein
MNLSKRILKELDRAGCLAEMFSFTVRTTRACPWAVPTMYLGTSTALFRPLEVTNFESETLRVDEGVAS